MTTTPDEPEGQITNRALAAVAHAAWHLMDDSGELAEEDMEGFHGDYVHLKLDHQKLSDALDRLEATGWDAHPEDDDQSSGRPLRVEVYGLVPDTDPQPYRWRVVHTSNGETMASGEGYADRRDRDHAVEVLFPDLEPVEVDR